MKINWKVRVKNKQFWAALIPATLILIQNVSSAFGYKVDVSGISESALSIINSLFIVLSIIGVVIDPTTQGIGDSEKALTYEEPF